MSTPSLNKNFKKALLAAQPKEKEGGFAISIQHEDVTTDNASEHFGTSYGDKEDREAMIKAGFITEESRPTITKKGWDQLNKDIRQLEVNSLAYLKKTFNSARDDGHDSHDDLVGSFWYSPTNKKQIEEIYTGINERIDMSDASYGSLANTVWKGVSSFGQSVLGGQISFFQIDKDEIEELYDAHQKK